MTASRLSNDDCNSIVFKVMVHKYRPKAQALQVKYHDLAKKVYDHAFSAGDKRRMLDLPEGWLPRTKIITVAIDGHHAGLEFSGYFPLDTFRTKLSMGDLFEGNKKIPDAVSKAKLVPFKFSRGQAAVAQFSKDDPLSQEFYMLERQRNTMLGKAKEDRDYLIATLKRYRSLAKLKREWPEIAQYVTHLEGPADNLPALPTSELNKRFELP